MVAKIFFATNRDIKSITSKAGKNFGDRFNAMGPQIFRVGEVEVTLDGDPLDTDDDVWKVGRCDVYDEQLNSNKGKGTKLGSADMFDLLRKRLKGSLSDVIVYVHGFASDFPNAARRAAEELGYRDVAWFRLGTDGWLDMGWPLAPVAPTPVDMD